MSLERKDLMVVMNDSVQMLDARHWKSDKIFIGMSFRALARNLDASLRLQHNK